MNKPSINTVQEVVERPTARSKAAHAACVENRWESFLDEYSPAPKPSWFSLAGRRDLKAYEACRKRALECWSGPKSVQVLIVPVWIGDHEGEEPDPDAWYRGHAISIDNQPLMLLGFGPYNEDAETILDTVVSCRARCWTVGNIINSRAYSPDIELALRAPPYGVVEGEIIEIEEVEVVNAGEPAPKPTLEVPPYCCWVKPRVDKLDPELIQQLRKCSITVDDEGQIIES